MSEPSADSSPLLVHLKDENIKQFNEAKASHEGEINLSGENFRGLDLRGLDAQGLDLTSAYLRMTDLRGIDFRNAKLEGATLKGAKISGCYFPDNISAEEIRLSIEHGTRLRVTNQ